MNKQLIFFLLSVTITVAANAQEYKRFRFCLGFGAARGNPDGVLGTGLLISLEPGYRISDDLVVSLRFEVPAVTPMGGSYESVSLNGQYYLSSNKFRPFVGAGFGSYEVDNGRQFGLYPRVGFDLAHFSMSLDYNYFINQKNALYYLYNYFGIRIGFFIGGGKK